MADKRPLNEWLDGYRNFAIETKRDRPEEVPEPGAPRLPTWAQRLRDDKARAAKSNRDSS